MRESHMAAEARANILNRVRRNLAVGVFRAGTKPASFEMQRTADRPNLQKPPIEVFEEELTLVGGTFQRVSSQEQLCDALRKVCDRGGYQNIAVSQEPLIEELQVAENLQRFLTGARVSKLNSLDPMDELRSADAGVTACEFLIAETGTIVLRSSPLVPRSLSLLPHAHIVIATEEQLFPTLVSCVPKLQHRLVQSPASSCTTLVTGPSRTADIEKVLVRGVHGPRELHVFVLVKSEEPR